MKKLLIILLVAIFILLFPFKIFGAGLFSEDFENCAGGNMYPDECQWYIDGDYHPNYWFEIVVDDLCSGVQCLKMNGAGGSDIYRNASPLTSGSLLFDFTPISNTTTSFDRSFAIGDWRTSRGFDTNWCASIEWSEDFLTNDLMIKTNNSEYSTTGVYLKSGVVNKLGFEWDFSDTKQVRFYLLNSWTDWFECGAYASSTIWGFVDKNTSGGNTDFEGFLDDFRSLGSDWYTDYWNCELAGYCWTWWPEGIYPVPEGGGTCAECEVDMCGVDYYSCPACETQEACENTEMCSWSTTTESCKLTDRYNCGDWSNCQFCESESTCTSTDRGTCYWEDGECKWDWYIPSLDEDLEDVWGLSGPLKSFFITIKTKFPVSWFFGIKEIWDEQITALETATSVAPLSISWTTPTSSVVAFSNKTFAIFDLEGANDEYGSQIAVFRTIMTYVIWLSTFMIIIGKTKAFFSWLGQD